MQADLILKQIPSADPEFIQSLESLPDPSPQTSEQFAEFLPQLHSLFIKKRQAAQDGNHNLFMEIVQQEMQLISKLDQSQT